MRESTNWSRSWKVRLNFLARLRNKLNKKVDKFFVNHYFGDQGEQQASPPPAHDAAAQGQPWTDAFEYNEASGSNHTSTQNSQYFDAVDAPEYLQQHQIPRFEFPNFNDHAGRMSSSQPGMVPGFHHDLGMYNTGPQFDHGMVMEHDQSLIFRDFVPMSVNEYNIDSEFSDAVTEMQRDEGVSSWQGEMAYSQGQGAPSMSMQMSGDTVETVDSNMMDTGDSNFTYVLPPHPEPQRGTLIKNILSVEELKRILLDEEAESRLPGRRGFRVVASIVYAYRRLRNLVRRKRMQRSASCSMSGEGSGSCKLKRIKSADCSRVYLGIKQRKGKWVAEIRFSKMPDKVWLGSFLLEKQAALAYDAGLHHCSIKRTKVFNFKESPQKLGPSEYWSLLKLSKEDRKTRVQRLACDHAMAYGSSKNIR